MRSEGGSSASTNNAPFTSAFTSSSESSSEPRRSSRNYSSRKLYASNKHDDYYYDKKFTSEDEVFKSHAHMHKMLVMLAVNINQQNSNESATLKEVMKRADWFKWLETMRSKYDSLIENDTWKLVKASVNRSVLIDR